MEPVLGAHSVLVLDGPEHLRQRKLLLPPFGGSRVGAFREVMREVAEREVAGWQAGARAGDPRADARAHIRGDLSRGVRRRHPTRVELLRRERSSR